MVSCLGECYGNTEAYIEVTEVITESLQGEFNLIGQNDQHNPDTPPHHVAPTQPT